MTWREWRKGIKIVEYALGSIRKKRIAGLMEKSCAKKKEFENFVKSTDNIRRDLQDGRKGRCHTVPGATSFDIFVSKTISGKLHLSFTPWRRARSNSIRPWILLFPWYCRFPAPLSRFYLAVGGDRVLSKSRGYARDNMGCARKRKRICLFAKWQSSFI